ncbi:MAG: hypothetical protein RL199_2056 [Pseudomonadota bacterium]|jgi:hypothetical protein
MLKRLELQGVGPAARLGPVDLAPRVNVITGDNGLGKSLLLDAAWWALTGSWPARPALPRPLAHGSVPPLLSATVEGKVQESVVTGWWSYEAQEWRQPGGRPPMPGLVVYFRVDGRFSLWDPAQHYWRRNKSLQVNDPDRPDALHFAPGEAWHSIHSVDGRLICRGLIEDWVTWQQTKSVEFELLCRVLEALSPSPGEPLVPGAPTRVWLDDVRLYPTLELPYGCVPVTMVSAGMQRVLLLSYLLVWAWRGHQEAAALMRQAPEQRLVLLFDEPETHLHPQWQRRLVPALMRVAEGLGDSMAVQMLVSTHSPLVLASLEPGFDADRDQLFHLAYDSAAREVMLDAVPFSARGDVLNWLVSPVFGLRQARSVEAEAAVEDAERHMRGEGGFDVSELDERLRRLLGGRDPFWPRWVVHSGHVGAS